jgi:adenylylsulfate reductase subunit A
MGLFTRRKTVFVDSDILVIGGGMAGCGATYETRYWGRDLKIVCVEKANIERSGAVAQGLYAINCYMGMQWNENQPEDHVRYARNDLMGLVREDLGYDIARHVDSTVHKFEEWGLPIMRDPKTGRYQREGKWQIMIHGESYKPIVAEAARKAATKVHNRIMVTHLLMDKQYRALALHRNVPRNENRKELPKTGIVFQAAFKRALGVTPGLSIRARPQH